MASTVANSKAKPVKNESSRQMKTIQTVLIQERVIINVEIKQKRWPESRLFTSGKQEREEIAGYKSGSLEP